MSPKDPEITSTLVGMEPIDLEDDQEQDAQGSPRLEPVRRPRQPDEPTFMPDPPRSVEATGLSRSYLESLLMKHLFLGGDMRGADLIRRTCLSSVVVEDVMDRLHYQRLTDIKGAAGAGMGRSGMIFTLTDQGHQQCRHYMDRDRYTGPAPVPFDYWVQAVRAQTIRNNSLRRADIEPHFSDLLLTDEIFDAIGPAMNSGKSLFFYGPPGNGKTAIGQRMTHCFGGDVFVPHAILVDDFVIQVFDQAVHQESEVTGPILDARWVRCKRPMVFVGGDLTLEELDLAYSPDVRFYEAPLQMKACCGVLLIDDFGRQRVSPKDLLNRWIVPLESEIDFLALHTGKKIEMPFDVFVVFSTNLDPSQLVDNAFLRRVRYKLAVRQPDRSNYQAIFKMECGRRGIEYRSEVFEHLLRVHYQGDNRPFNACEPRDLLSQVEDLCAYRDQGPHLTTELIDAVAHTYFVRFGDPDETSDTLARV